MISLTQTQQKVYDSIDKQKPLAKALYAYACDVKNGAGAINNEIKERLAQIKDLHIKLKSYRIKQKNNIKCLKDTLEILSDKYGLDIIALETAVELEATNAKV